MLHLHRVLTQMLFFTPPTTANNRFVVDTLHSSLFAPTIINRSRGPCVCPPRHSWGTSAKRRWKRRKQLG